MNRYGTEALKAYHNRKSFSCGIDALDSYLHQRANQDSEKHVAAVFVLTETGKLDVIGYYTLSAIGIDAGELPKDLTKRLPKYNLLPATLLGRLAVDRQYQRKGFGGLLIVDALQRVVNLSKEIASMAVIVDAKNEAAVTFYERYGFIRFINNNNRLYLPLDTFIKAFNPL
jgi:GNAT superfamily N-acetyltransferase